MAKEKKNDEVTIDQRSNERRDGDRRKTDAPVAAERRQSTRRKVQRRRQIDPTTCERDYSDDEIEFMRALDDYKRSSGRMFPTCSELLEVVRDLGYVRLTAEEREARESGLKPAAEEALELEATPQTAC